MSSAPRRERYRALVVSASVILLVASATLAVQVTTSSAGTASPGPAFVQQASAHASSQSKISVVSSSDVTTGNRLIVEVGVWKSAGATTTSVTDSTSDPFVEVTHFVASDGAEMSVWTAPVRSGGVRPTITATPSTKADLGIVALEYSGLSTVADATVVDQLSHASGITAAAASVNSTPTPPTTEANELAVGFYADSGFGDTLAAGSGFTQRANVSPTGNIEMLAEDRTVPLGATPAASAQTGANAIWLMATVVFESSLQAVPQPPTNVSATPGNAAATVTWAAPPSGGSAITSYTVTPYVNGVAQTPTVVAGGPPPTSAVPGGLTNGTTYTFTVTATNANGTSMPSAASVPVTPNSDPQGQWGSLITFPMVAISSILMDNGSFIFWDGWQQPEPTEVWNPGTPTTFTTIDAPDSVFCDGAAQLPDGRIIVIGGYGGLSTGQLGIVDTNIFDPATNTWTRVANMNLPRWYPTLTELPDGDYVAISGNSTDPNHWADTPEVYDPTTNTWTLLTKISTPEIHEEEYPFSYLIPNGNVLTIGPAEDVTYEMNVGAQTWTPVGGQSGIRNGSSIQYLPGKILYSGGAASVITTKPAQAATAVLDTTAATPVWHQTAPMIDARVYHTLTMLANGEVLAVGGGTNSNQLMITTGVLPTEIWNPASETWSASTPIAAARNYHSTAVLMPDGRVLVAGGGHPEGLNDAGQDSAQIYTPSYLYNGSRPTITSIPSTTTYGSTISVTTPDASSITAVNLVSLGTDTHQMDMNQHFVPLSFTAGSGSLNVTMPTSAAIAPPGHYMLFILNGQGTPSVAPILGLGPSTTPVAPSAPTGVTATAGDGTATVSWTAPANGGSPITSYTVTPSTGSTTLTPTVVTGTPPATTATIGGLSDGVPYTFTVTATNGVGTGPPSLPSNTVTPTNTAVPAFVQQASKQVAAAKTLSVTPAAPLGSGNRLVVEVGVWNSTNATTASVTDSAGDTFTEVGHFTGSDKTEQSVWTAPITTGGGTEPAVTATFTSKAAGAIAALEYSGLSTAAGSGAVDQESSASGTTTTGTSVSSGPTAATAGADELAIGFYSDSGFKDSLSAGAGYIARAVVPNNANMELMAEDQLVGAGATPAASAGTGPNTIWEMATVVFEPGSAPTNGTLLREVVASKQAVPEAPNDQAVVHAVPGSPGRAEAVAGDRSATVRWATPRGRGLVVSLYRVTPYLSGVAQPATMVSGSPPPTSVDVTGLTNRHSYTFTVTAINALGTGPASPASRPVRPRAIAPPRFVQQESARGASVSSIAVTMPRIVTDGDRLVVEVAVRNTNRATAANVTDSAGDTFTEVTSVAGADGTELSVWTAPVTQSGGTRPTITATPTSDADMGIVALEYAGLSGSSGPQAVDQSATATGRTPSARSVSSGSTMATTSPDELAVGFYADARFAGTLRADPGYRSRLDVAPPSGMQLFVEDTVVGKGAEPADSVWTGARTHWEMATVAFER
jgi:hypothetical protein